MVQFKRRKPTPRRSPPRPASPFAMPTARPRPPVPTPLPRRARGGAGARGFTLVELLVTIVIAGVLSLVAAPAMTRMLGSNRVQTENASLVSDLQFARAEAIKQGQPVTVCASADGTNCLGANTWQGGWVVFADKAGNGVYDASADGPVLRRRAAFPGKDTFIASPTTTAVIFNRDGFTSNLGTSVVTFKLHTADNDAKATRCVAVSIGGRLMSLAAGQGACS
jgi:type IV fimbrial biogenesis protein FimT